jgi:hypothetical protein
MYWSAAETFRVSVERLPSVPRPRHEAHTDTEEESFGRIVLTNSVAEEPEDSSPHSQQLATGPYPESIESTPPPPAISDPFWSYTIYASVFRVVSFLWDFLPNPCTLFSPLPCVQHVLPTSFALTCSAKSYLEISTNYEATHCATSFELCYHKIMLVKWKVI